MISSAGASSIEIHHVEGPRALLAKRPADRYADVITLIHDLRDAVARVVQPHSAAPICVMTLRLRSKMPTTE